ncbi:MAG TPA: hypothetical protein VL563_01090 [Gemmatimonadales bacterium]|jgi:hypothetical protein|nr:hypothetical protein [Gemmatimonadales bacterium]
MKFVLGIMLGCLTLAAPAFAQTGVDLDKATFAWDWTQGTGGAVTEFRIKCGPSVGVYPNVTVIPNPAARTFPVKSAIAGAGVYHCILTAANQYGESLPTNDVFFAAGVTPSSSSNFRVTP